MSQPYFPEKPEDLSGPAEIGAVSGLDFMRGVAEGRFPAPPIARTLGFALDSVAKGEVVFRGTPNFGAYNPVGGVHGGWFGTLLDSCMACAVMTELPQGLGYTTLDYTVNIVRPLFTTSGDVLAVGQALRVGRRAGTAEGKIIGAEDGKLYAFGTTTCLVFPLE